jgi:chemotaxis protein CheZ
MAGEVKMNDLHNLKEFFEKMGMDSQDQRHGILEEIISFMDALVGQDYEKANNAVHSMMKKGQDDLFKEVGKITRKIHTAINGFKEAIDPRFKEIATVDMPNVIDKLQLVIDKTEEAANKTMETVEKYILNMDDLASHIRNLEGPESSVDYLKEFKNKLENDLTGILMAQSFQDITGQIIKKVIKLVGDIEEELVRLITTFGLKIEQGVKTERTEGELISQSGVDDLLKEFGF